MRLRTKFTLLLVSCILGGVYSTTVLVSRQFLVDKESSIKELQTRVALFSKKQLENRMNLLYSQLEQVIDTDPATLKRVISGLDGCTSFNIQNVNENLNNESAWSLIPPSEARAGSYLLWVGRYQNKRVTLELKAEWFNEILEASPGGRTELVAEDGTVLLKQVRDSSIQGRELFHNGSVLQQLRAEPKGVPQTKKYESVERKPFLGTFLSIGDNPSLYITVTTPWEIIESALIATYQKATWVAFVLLIFAVGVGVAFSRHLTAHLHELAHQVLEVAKGRFDAHVEVSRKRRDEVGVLERAFNLMGRKLNKMRDELRRKERLATLGTFSAAIAHEIKNPLSAILGNSQAIRRILEKPDADLAKVLKALHFVEDETLRANRIITELMKFSRKEKPPTISINLADRIQRSLEILKPELESASIRITSDIYPSLWCVGDEDQLHEVISNLVHNAMHAVASSEKKEIFIKAYATDQMVSFEIKDTGTGIEKEVIDHLFEPFFTTKPIGQGTGLGLAVCHGIVNNHKGQILVQSEVGKGATFIVRFPKQFPFSRAA